MEVSCESLERMTSHRRRVINRIIFILSLVLLIVMLANFELVVSVVTVYYRMSEIAAWAESGANVDVEEEYFDELKEVARFLLRRSEHSRRLAIVAYNLHSRNNLAASGGLFYLMRLLFDLPEDYEGNDLRHFENFVGEGDSPGNLLWPLGYDENGELILKYEVRMWVCYGLCPYYYEGQREYDYFAARFPLRSVDELE